AGESGKVVVKLGVRQEFAGSVVVLIEFGGSGGEVGAGIAELIVERVVSREFTESAFTGADVADHTVTIVHGFLGFIVERGIVEKLAHGAFLSAEVGEDGVDLIDGLVDPGGSFIGHEEFTDGALASLDVADNLIA